MSAQRFARRSSDLRVSQRIAEAVLDYVGQPPVTTEHARASPEPHAQALARAAARQAAATAGSLTLPPGPLGWLTLLPELRALWRLQTQMVADIAAGYGRVAGLGREEMLYCLFRHTDPQLVRELVARAGKRFVVQRASRPEVQAVAVKIALHIAQRMVGRGVARWLPVFGALGAGAYAYYDTVQVARTAIEFFSGAIDAEVVVVDGGDESLEQAGAGPCHEPG
ncbi:hypothetical protein [Accumulibacter sp.]|uniref:hypothetical protein n=1 Tax=Accumulibacter sp. TaxID=2053492 RepID=UPI0025C4CE07|nr:hypothetical protein [Accumulibacter sp.]